MLYCQNCEKDVEEETKEKVFKNGTKHIEATCGECHKFIKWLGKDIDPTQYIMPYGKYAGFMLGEIKDREYLHWLYENSKPRLQEMIDSVLSNKNIWL